MRFGKSICAVRAAARSLPQKQTSNRAISPKPSTVSPKTPTPGGVISRAARSPPAPKVPLSAQYTCLNIKRQKNRRSKDQVSLNQTRIKQKTVCFTGPRTPSQKLKNPWAKLMTSAFSLTELPKSPECLDTSFLPVLDQMTAHIRAIHLDRHHL